jgi:hypothetical protein
MQIKNLDLKKLRIFGFSILAIMLLSALYILANLQFAKSINKVDVYSAHSGYYLLEISASAPWQIINAEQANAGLEIDHSNSKTYIKLPVNSTGEYKLMLKDGPFFKSELNFILPKESTIDVQNPVLYFGTLSQADGTVVKDPRLVKATSDIEDETQINSLVTYHPGAYATVSNNGIWSFAFPENIKQKTLSFSTDSPGGNTIQVNLNNKISKTYSLVDSSRIEVLGVKTTIYRQQLSADDLHNPILKSEQSMLESAYLKVKGASTVKSVINGEILGETDSCAPIFGVAPEGCSCNWKDWQVNCMPPMNIGSVENPSYIYHEVAGFCGANGKVEKFYPELNPRCTAEWTGIHRGNPILENACSGDPTVYPTDENGCGQVSVTDPSSSNTSSSSGATGDNPEQTPLVTDVEVAVSPSNVPSSAPTPTQATSSNDYNSGVFTSAICPVDISSITGNTYIRQIYNGVGFKNSAKVGESVLLGSPGEKYSHALPSIGPQNATDIGLDNGQIIRSPIDAKVVDIQTPQETLFLYTKDKVDLSGKPITREQAEASSFSSDFCDHVKTPAGKEYYDGGFVIILSDPEGKTFWRLVHLEKPADNIKVGATIKKGDVISTVFDGLFDSGETYTNEFGQIVQLQQYSDQSNQKGGCRSSIHLHFALMTKDQFLYSEDQTLPKPNETYNSTEYLIAKCKNIVPDPKLIKQCFGNTSCNPIQAKPESVGFLNPRGLINQVSADDDDSRGDAGKVTGDNILPPLPEGLYAPIVNGQANTQEVALDGSAIHVHYFVDKNGNGVKDEGELELDDEQTKSFNVSFAKTGEQYAYNLNRGWNLIGMPFKTDVNSAKKLVEYIEKYNSALSGRITVSTYQQANNFLVYSLINSSPAFKKQTGESFTTLSNDFALTPGQGIFVYVSDPTELKLYGQNYQENPHYALTSGWNLVNIYDPNWQDKNAYDLLTQKSVSLVDKQIMQVAKLDGTTYVTAIKKDEQDFGWNFPLDKKESYFVYVE